MSDGRRVGRGAVEAEEHLAVGLKQLADGVGGAGGVFIVAVAGARGRSWPRPSASQTGGRDAGTVCPRRTGNRAESCRA